MFSLILHKEYIELIIAAPMAGITIPTSLLFRALL